MSRGSAQVRATIGPHYGIVTRQPFDVRVGSIQLLARDLRKAHGIMGTNNCHHHH